jgi:two-component system chemotaxis response regulator CheY
MEKAACRILTVDDHRLSLRLVQQHLEILGFTNIETASDGEVAWKRMEAESFDIVILDWAMPVKNGMTFLKECRAQKKFDHIAMIMLSAEMQPEMIDEAMKAGANAYIVKPMTQSIFKENMDNVLMWIEKNREKVQHG